MPATRSSSTARPTSSRSCLRASCAASSRSSATASCSIRKRSSTRSRGSRRRGSKITPEILRVASNVPLILPLHRELDAAREASNAGTRIGTTKRGIGPAYEDKVGRRAIRLMDLAEPDTLAAKVERLLAHHNALRRGLGMEEVDAQALERRACARWRRRCCPIWTPSGACSTRRAEPGRRILFEGAQGALLDVDHGTYPFVTSSSTVAGAAAAGSGLGPGAIDYVLGIAKAYTTRVGEGPFPTELHDEIGARIGEKGREFGVVTGRKRRCGWFDAVLVRQTVSTSGIDGIALTKLDILDGFEEIKICVGYKLDGREIDHLPASEGGQARVEPVYRNLRRLVAIDGRRSVLGRSAGAGDQICAPSRGVDRGARRHPFDQP